ncbi:hypothetical protein KGF56_002400 [Candida oxycetoniae]|uniref:Protein ATP11, mitochondrial n=1 Tax=Candida oxycetoniae TaxID=497107 RepID=A0AAI9WY88_9ASCO|nr:uncharacterized protein KGF56_002400 [Candida oxycetoniae]KAI3404770.2 hypothetical protein KGF56_002400 [Candida oxycetoniae]
MLPRLQRCVGINRCVAQFHAIRFNSVVKDTKKKLVDDGKSKKENGFSDDVLNRYKAQLEQKARELGLDNVAALKDKYKDQIEKIKSELGTVDFAKEITNWESSQQKDNKKKDSTVINVRSPRDKSAEKKQTPYKTLDDYVDVEKIKKLSRDEIEFLWKTRFQKDPQSLHAVINNKQFDGISENAARYPYFILPLPKKDDTTKKEGYQLEFVQWSFVAEETIHCLFTSLAEYKLHGEFAKPHVVLTFHQDLSKDKDIVLMQGWNEKDGGLSTEEAQLLVLNLQRFYNGKFPQRLQLVKEFSEGSEKFSLDKLVNEATTV